MSPIVIKSIVCDEFSHWLEQQPEQVKNWMTSTNFTAKPESYSLIPDANGNLSQVILGIKNKNDFWDFGVLPLALPPNNYRIENMSDKAALAWGLGAYQFARYKKPSKSVAQLIIPENINNVITSIYLVRDLINTPTEDMGPEQLAQAVINVGQPFNAKITQIIGNELLENNYPSIHTVGRASNRPPRLIDLRWGDENAPKITLVGKGVCFDSGGLNIKPANAMELMKKDMGGAANALGLAAMIMAANLPIRLRLLIPAVENVISDSAYKPGDIIRTRKGITVEVGNTDAEGRLILCDALTEAATESPDLLLDFSTLTGAARVAVGTEISALFTDQNDLAQQLISLSEQEQDPIWRMPLYTPYRRMIDSPFADINNSGASPYAGAITAALFLKEFVPAEIPWAHFDFNAWNVAARPGRPIGGEAMAIRAVFEYLRQKYL